MSDIPPVIVRAAVPEDAPRIRDFNIAMARETESRRLDAGVVDAGVRRLFERPEYGFYLLAECDGSPVGSLMVTMEWSDWRDMSQVARIDDEGFLFLE